jgi:Cof subfamily protein (haloacid dehalogenase superfamily)
MKQTYKLVASDLDGTFLTKDQRVSPENLSAVAEMERRGVYFVPSTGRCVNELPKEVSSIPSLSYVITSDGSVIWDKKRECTVWAEYIPKELVGFILDTVNEYPNYPMVHIANDCYFDKEKHIEPMIKKCRVPDSFVYLANLADVPLDDYDGFVRESSSVEMFCIFFENEEDLRACEKKFLDTGLLSVAQSDRSNLEIYVKSAGKGNALRALAEHLSIDISEVIAVGDSTNDATLVKAAGLGLAMGNAYDELKSIADEVICHFSEHSAKYILEKYL